MSASRSTPRQPRQTLKLDPEYAKWVEPFGDAAKPKPIGTILELREATDISMTMAYSQFPAQPSITRTNYRYPSYDGVEIEVVRFATKEQTAQQERPQPAVIFLHGGGMVGASIDTHAPLIALLAALSGVQFFAFAYRLAPEHPDPTPSEDCYAGLQWLSTHAAEFGVDPTRLGLMGDSAGGGLAAATSLIARDRGLEPPVKKQILVYPMLDDRSIVAMFNAPNASTGFMDEFTPFPISHLYMFWEAYIGKEKVGKADADVSPYAAPSRAADFRGLPSTYMDVGGLDPFRDDCTSFATRLAGSDVEVEFHLFPGLPHGFDISRDISATKAAYERRIRWIKDI